MRRLVLASLRGSSRRLVAGGIAIVMSVGFMSAVLFAMDSAKAHITSELGKQYTVADHVVDNASRQDAAESIAELDGVEATSQIGLSYANATVGTGSDAVKLAELMATVPADETMRWQQTDRGRLPTGPGEVAVTEALARKHDLAVGDTMVFHGAPGTPGASDESKGSKESTVERRATLVGTLTEPGPENAPVFASENGIDQLAAGAGGQVLVRGSLDGVSDARLAELAGEQAVALTVEEKVEQTAAAVTGGVNVYGAMLLGFAGIALFVALLVVTNTFTIVLAQRSRELALYRCVGAGRGQVFGAVVMESVLLGVLTSLLGLLAGAGIAAGAIALLGRFMPGLAEASLVVSPISAVAALAVGTAVTVLAALSPARRATQVAPLAALRPEPGLRARSTAGALRLTSGAVMLLVGAGMMALGIGLDDPQLGMLLGVGGGAVSFVGVLLFGPILAPAVVRLLGTIARTAGVPGKVSVTNSVRNPRRTAATTSALLVGVTLITMLTVGAASSQRTSEQALDNQMPIDLVMSVNMQGNEGKPLAPEAVRTAKETEGMEKLAVERGVTGRVQGTEVMLSSVPLERARDIVRNPEPLRGFGEGVLLLGPTQADTVGAKDGDTVSVKVGDRQRDFEVAIASDNATPEALITAADLRAMDGENRAEVTGVWGRFVDGLAPAEMNDQLKALQEADPEATQAGSAPTRAMYQQVIDILLLVAVALLGMAVLIALIGVGNTLSLSVLERIRENALLRALGLTRGQLRGTLAIEAGLIAGAAVVLGLVLGTVYGYLGTSTLFAAVDQAPQIALAIPVGRVVLIALVAMAAGVLASVLPARTAANIPPARAL